MEDKEELFFKTLEELELKYKDILNFENPTFNKLKNNLIFTRRGDNTHISFLNNSPIPLWLRDAISKDILVL